MIDLTTYALLRKQIATAASGISDVRAEGDELIFVLADGSEVRVAVPTTGIRDAEVRDEALVLTLADGQELVYTPTTTVVDATLTQSGQAADAKATGDALDLKLTEPSTGLAVGKYFRIAAIDESGHAVLEAVDGTGGLSTEPSLWPLWTSDEQAAARKRMGLPGDYELIEEIICDGTASAYTRNVDPSGNPYDFESVYIDIEIQTGNTYTNVFFRAYDELNQCVLYDGASVSSKTYTSYLCSGCYADKGLYHGWTISQNIASANIGGSQTVRNNRPTPVVSTIKKVYVNIVSGTFFAGDKIRIYGVIA